MRKLISLIAICMLFTLACTDKTTINQDIASGLIIKYLNANPEFKTTDFKFGEIKVNSVKDKTEFGFYRSLESKGLVTIQLMEAKKKFLSKDSSFVYQVRLNEAASPLVLKQSNSKATVKSVEYMLMEGEPVDFTMVNSNTANVTVSLKKINTDFSAFEKNPNQHSDFITKTYKLKLDKVEGWKIQK